MSCKFTCLNCRVAFSDAEFQRQHYKTDWHRYNLKRKVADLPPVSAEEFQKRVLLQREQDEALEKDNSVFCNICHKTFNGSNSFENHLKSKKHLNLAERSSEASSHSTYTEVSNKTISENNLLTKNVASVSVSDDDSSVEEVDSDEWDDDFSNDNPILRNDCLFCSNHSATMTKNLKHMTVAHSFFIPDIEYLIDLKGLLCYLGEKISSGYMCLWCNDRGKTFLTKEAAQQHMIDKGHCKMLHEGEALLEYSDYYDYRRSYPDYNQEEKCFDNEKLEEDVDIPVLEDGDYQLVLPSGSIIGHRSLMRYYRYKN